MIFQTFIFSAPLIQCFSSLFSSSCFLIISVYSLVCICFVFSSPGSVHCQTAFLSHLSSFLFPVVMWCLSVGSSNAVSGARTMRRSTTRHIWGSNPRRWRSMHQIYNIKILHLACSPLLLSLQAVKFFSPDCFAPQLTLRRWCSLQHKIYAQTSLQ